MVFVKMGTIGLLSALAGVCTFLSVSEYGDAVGILLAVSVMVGTFQYLKG